MKYAIIKTVWRKGDLLSQILYTSDKEAARRTMGDARSKMIKDKASGEITNYSVYLAEIIDGSTSVLEVETKAEPTKKDIKAAMARYLGARGYLFFSVSCLKGHAEAVLHKDSPPSIAHFTEVSRHTVDGTYWVRLSSKDFDNELITNKLFNL